MCCFSCGYRNAETAELRDKLIGTLIGLARATFGNEDMVSASTYQAVIEGLLANEESNQDVIYKLIHQAEEEKRKLIPLCYSCAAPCGRTDNYDMKNFREAEENVRNIKFRILVGIREIANYIYHARCYHEEISTFLYRALFALGEDRGADQLRSITAEVDTVKLKCKALTSKTAVEACPEKK